MLYYIFIIHLSRVLHLALCHIECDVISRGSRCETAKLTLKQILQGFHTLWLEFFEAKRRREEEEDSLYKFKGKSHCVDSDEFEKNERSFTSFFPSFDKDYLDVIPKDALNDSGTDTIEQSCSTSVDDNTGHEMGHIDTCHIFNSLKIIMNDGSQLKDKTLVDTFLCGYREFCSLSSLAVIKNGEYPY